LAACNGNAEQAYRQLKEQGMERPPAARTMRGWKRTDEYLETRTSVLPKIRQAQAEAFEGQMYRQMEVADEALTLLKPQLKEMEARDLSAAHRNLIVGTGITGQRAGEARGDASVVEHRSQGSLTPDELEKKLKRMGLTISRSIDAEAVEVEDVAVADVRGADAESLADVPPDTDTLHDVTRTQ
jgi:hypothetical protein